MGQAQLGYHSRKAKGLQGGGFWGNLMNLILKMIFRNFGIDNMCLAWYTMAILRT
jgi:hypothetical protein